MALPRFAQAVHFLAPLAVSAAWWGATLSNAAELTLFDGTRVVPGGQIETNRAQIRSVTIGGTKRLSVTPDAQGEWPGVTVRPAAAWDLSGYGRVEAALYNPGPGAVSIYCRVDNPGADGVKACLTGSLRLEPGCGGTLTVPLIRTRNEQLEGKLFGMRGYPVANGGPGTIVASNITGILLFLDKDKHGPSFEVIRVGATGRYTPPTAWVSDADPFLPFIDAFGQYRHKQWPGKVMSEADLQERRRVEELELAKRAGPADWDQYGGWTKGPKQQATGFFRTQKLGGKWWLVDPEGNLFFSQGIDCVGMLDTTPVEEREQWFHDFPGAAAPFAGYASHGYALKGHYAGKSPACFSFAGANLARKYGSDWRQVYPGVVRKRLRSWGINTVANWSDQSMMGRGVAYTDTVGSHNARMIEGSEGYWSKFPDVFDPSFESAVRRAASAKLGKSAGDPWCIGYFSDNEMSWGNEDSIASGALRSPAEQPAKKVLLADLRSKYGEIRALNQVWGTAYASWDALLESRDAPDAARARDDLVSFYRKCAETYFKVVRDSIKTVAPHQLYLGCRFAWVNPVAATAAGKYCDVVSYNLYQRGVADFRFNGEADVPLIIGEFHFGALDRGLFHTGLVPVEDQAARAKAYRDYVLGALRHPQFIGCHWFQYQDEPTTGRVYDEENYQIGFVDIADTPYAEMIEASRETARTMYPERMK